MVTIHQCRMDGLHEVVECYKGNQSPRYFAAKTVRRREAAERVREEVCTKWSPDIKCDA